MNRSSAAKRSTTAVGSEDENRWPLVLATLAVTALVEVAELTPKPALVDRRGSGADQNLDLALVRSSAMALKDGFAAIAAVSASAARPSERLREELGRIGRDMEHRMLAATGRRTHRGAIWMLGSLVAAAARRRGAQSAVGVAARAAALAAMPDRFEPRVLSDGDRVRLRFGAAGARGEAQAAFPHVIRIGLPALRDGRGRGTSEDEARLDALMAIMSTLEDTCLLYRGGRAALDTAQVGARAVLDAGGTATQDGRERLQQLEADLVALQVTPRGSAAVLSATLVLDQLESSNLFNRSPIG